MRNARKYIVPLLVALALTLLPTVAMAAGSCATYSNSDTTSQTAMPYFVNLLINNLPYILAVIAIALLAFAALDNGGLPAAAKNGLTIAGIVLLIGALLSFLLNWHPVCFS